MCGELRVLEAFSCRLAARAVKAVELFTCRVYGKPGCMVARLAARAVRGCCEVEPELGPARAKRNSRNRSHLSSAYASPEMTGDSESYITRCLIL